MRAKKQFKSGSRKKGNYKKFQSSSKKGDTQMSGFNRQAQWKAFQDIQYQADAAWKKFKDDVRKNAKSDIIIKDQNHLLLLLGECNYMANECMRIANRGKKKRK